MAALKVVVAVITAMAALGLFMLVVATVSQNKAVEERDSITVGTSIFPLADITRNIGGPRVTVVEIIPPGASPHSYTLTPQQVADLQRAVVVFTIGAGLEDSFIQSVVEGTNARNVEVYEGIVLRQFGSVGIHHEDIHADDAAIEGVRHEHERGSVDPHYWLSVPNAQLMSHTVAKTLQEIDPLHADEYENNLQRYMRELNQLEIELQTMAASVRVKQFVAMHDAWSYFAHQYGFELAATYEPVEGREPSVADIRDLQDILTEYGITTFYTEPQKASSAATRFIQQELNMRIMVLDPIGGTGTSRGYISLMRNNMRAIVEGSR